MKKIFITILLIYSSLCFSQEKIYLTNGDSLSGTVSEVDVDHVRITRENGKSSVVLTSMIKEKNIRPTKMRIIKDSETYGLQEVVMLNSINKTEAFNRAMLWASNMGNFKSIIDYSDKESGIIKGSFTCEFIGWTAAPCWYKFSIKIEIKDEKTRLTIDQISSITTLPAGTSIERYMIKNDGSVKTFWQSDFEKMQKSNYNIYSSFVKSMQNKISDF